MFDVAGCSCEEVGWLGFVKVEVGEAVEGGGVSKFTTGEFERGNDADHPSIVGDEFFGVREKGAEAVFASH